VFNFGKENDLLVNNPTDKIRFFPEVKLEKYVPPEENIDKVIAVAIPEDQDYLWVIRETMEQAASPVVEIAVPIVVDCDSGDSWNEAH